MKPLSVLLIAEAANPEWVSVPLEGWCHARAIAKLTQAHLVTQVRNREAILRALSQEDFQHPPSPLPSPSQGGRGGKAACGLRSISLSPFQGGEGQGEGAATQVTFIDSEKVDRWVWRLGSLLRGGEGKGWTTVTALKALSYYYFEDRVWRQFKTRIQAGEFDLVHRLTPLSPTVPSLLAVRCRRAGVPFILGPLNGGLAWPRGFDSVRRKEKEWFSPFRSAYKLLPAFRSTREASSAILVGSRAAGEEIPAAYREKCFYVPESGFDPLRFQSRRTHKASRPLRAIFVGRLVPYKGADLLIEAAAPLLRGRELTVEIAGDGPQKKELESRVRREHLEGGVFFSGWVPHSELAARLSRADLFVAPSLREFGGGAVLEAMAAGLVPVVVNYGGPGELVTPETGFLIPMQKRGGIVAELREVLRAVAADPSLIEAKSPLALRRAHEHFTWDAKARQVLGIYRRVLEQGVPGGTSDPAGARAEEMELWMR